MCPVAQWVSFAINRRIQGIKGLVAAELCRKYPCGGLKHLRTAAIRRAECSDWPELAAGGPSPWKDGGTFALDPLPSVVNGSYRASRGISEPSVRLRRRCRQSKTVPRTTDPARILQWPARSPNLSRRR